MVRMVSHLTTLGWRVVLPIGPQALVYERKRRSLMKTTKKPSVKKLALSKETLRTLKARELTHIVGGDLEILASPTGWFCTRLCGNSLTTV
jgi:hypothetical protein